MSDETPVCDRACRFGLLPRGERRGCLRRRLRRSPLCLREFFFQVPSSDSDSDRVRGGRGRRSLSRERPAGERRGCLRRSPLCLGKFIFRVPPGLGLGSPGRERTESPGSVRRRTRASDEGASVVGAFVARPFALENFFEKNFRRVSEIVGRASVASFAASLVPFARKKISAGVPLLLVKAAGGSSDPPP